MTFCCSCSRVWAGSRAGDIHAEVNVLHGAQYREALENGEIESRL